MPNSSPTIIAASLNDEELRKSINKLVNHLDDQLHYMVASTKVNVKSINDALEKIGDVDTKLGSKGSKSGETSKQIKAQNAETESVKESTRAYKAKEITLDQQSSAINTAIQSEKKYTEEIRKQAAAIRATKEWQERGGVIIGEKNYYDPERANVTKRERAQLLTLEEQIVQVQQKQAQEALVAAEAKRQQAQAAKEVASASLPTPLYDVSGIDTNVSVARARQIAEGKEAARRQAEEYSTLEKVVARYIGVSTQELALNTSKNGSYNALSDSLKKMTAAYHDMTKSERESVEGKNLAISIQQTQRAVQKLQQTMSRPINLKDVMGLTEKTLDDIAYKIRQLQSYKYGLDLSNPRQAAEMHNVDAEIKRLNKDMNKYMENTKQVTQMNQMLANSWRYMKNRLAFYFTVSATTSFIRNLIEVRSQYEMNEKALGILIDSAERGTQVFKELSDMALVSPYTLIELSSAAKQLSAYDIAAKDVVDTTRRLADISAAVGVPVERFTYALGQVKAFGHLTSQDARQFLNTGVPLVKELAKHYTELEGRLVSTADVYDRMKQHAVSYNDVILVLNEMTDEGGKFFDYQAKMAETLKVQLANLTLAWNNMLNDIGQDWQGWISTGISGLKELFLHWQTLDRILNNVAITLGTAKALQMLLNLTFGKGTLEIIKNTAALKGATAANFQYALAKANIGKAEAKLLVSLYRNNAALKEAIFNLKLLSAEEINAASKATLLGHNLGFVGMAGKKAMLGLVAVSKAAWVGVKMLSSSLLSLFTNPAFVALAATMAITDAIMYANQLDDKMKEMNQNIANGAKEAAKSMGDFLKESVMIANRQKALNNSLSAEEGEKAWNALREQIELSSDASDIFISKLLLEEDINKRVAESFAVADKIREATEAISALDEEALKVSQDSWLGGIFGEGLGEDLEDYIEMIKDFREEASSRGLGGNAIKMWAADTQSQNEVKEEMQKLADDVAQVLRDRLGEGIGDPVKIREALERIKKEIKAANPKIKGEVANFFDVNLEELLKPQFRALGKGTTALQQQFLQVLKRDYSSAFADITDDIFKENARWGKDQENTIKKAAEKFKTITVPEFHSAIDEMVRDMNSRDWRIRIATTMGTVERSDFQKDWDTRFAGKGAGIYDAYRPKDGIDLPSYAKEQRDAIKKLKGDVASYTKDSSAYSTERRQKAEDEIRVRTELLNAYKQPLEEESTKKGGSTSKKDILGDALAKEVQLIGEIQKRYKEYQQMGVNAQEAVTLATEEYGNTLKRTNATLAKYGIATKSSDELAGMDIREVRDYYKALLEGAKNKDNAKGIEAIEKALANINVEITKLDYKKITDGLNNELGKLKDEYELALELDADPELGNMFAELWGIDMDALPHTAQEYAKGVTESLNKYLKDAKTGLEIEDVLGLTDDDLGFLDDLLESESITQTAYDLIQKVVKAARDARNKEIKDSINGYEKLLEKYSEYEYKMLQIERTANNERKAFAMKFGNDSQKSEVIGLITDIDIEKDPQKKEQLKEQLKKVLTEIAGSDAAKLQLTVAIDNRELQEGAKLAFEEFKKTPDWIVATGDLAGLTDKALRGLIKRVEDYKKKAKNLDPKQIKEINRALKALHKQVREGNPFAAIIDVIEQSDERAKEYQPELDGIMSDIISLEKEIGDNDPTEEQAEHLKTLKDKWLEVKKTQEETGKVDVKQLTSSINDSIQAASQATKVFTDMMDAIAGEGNNASQTIKDITSVLEKGGQGAAIGAQIGGGYGAIIGAAAGVVTGLVSVFAGAGNRRITEAVEESERAVKRLENRVESLKGSYDAMTDSAEHSYGAQSAAATLTASSIKEQEIAMKRLMLAETRRQLRLEQSRDSKDRDDDKILSLQKDIISQQNEVDSMLRETDRAVEEVVDSLLGISRGSWAEELTDALISAFKAGEDYMDVFEDSWEEMVQNMVVKTIAARVIGDALEKHVLSKIEQMEKEATGQYTQQLADLEQHKANLRELRGNDQYAWFDTIQKYPEFKEIVAGLGEDGQNYLKSLEEFGDVDADPLRLTDTSKYRRILVENYGDQIEKALFERYDNWGTDLNRKLNQAQQTAQENALREVLTGTGGAVTKEALMQSVSSVLPDMMKTWGIQFGQDAEKELSALQRGISGITEQQAGALEAITNGMYQQITLQSGILQQINIAVQSFNFDAQLGTTSQILLQLQTTYQNQQAIRSIMEGWTNASGMAVRVEMV